MNSFTTFLPLVLAIAALFAVVLAVSAGVWRSLGDKADRALFRFMVGAGLVLMAEQTSRQAARLASNSAGGKLRAADHGELRVASITSPASVTWANGDTIGGRQRIPAGSRLLHAQVSCADMGTSITLDVGVRAWKPDGTGSAIDADGIVAALDVASAAVSAMAMSGAMVKDGTDTGVLTQDAEPYFTLNGGTPTANAQIRVDVYYTAP